MNQDYQKGPQPIWEGPKQQLFTKPVSASPTGGSSFSWGRYTSLMYLGGGAIGLALGLQGDGLFYIVVSVLMGAALGALLSMLSRGMFHKSYYPWMYLLWLCLVPFVIYLFLPMVMGAVKAAMIVIAVLLVLALLGSLFG